MLIHPNNQWHWLFDPDKSAMTLELGDELLFVSALTTQRCVPYAQGDQPFSTEHAELYYAFLEGLDSFEWPAPVKVHVVLNAVAMVLFHKPMMPQSWFFKPIAHQYFTKLTVGEVVVCQGQEGNGRFVLLESNEKSYTLMYIDKQLSLDGIKHLQQFDTIKVMHDRVLPLRTAQSLGFARSA
ncbi:MULTISPECIES: cell division protein ZapC domain-containing protein [Aliagarivorans]|uniref:cell division protein ZapC domain-containing protein n=1 Tax=Aliagarivorans TaxID=882379 RepID=UPI0003F53FA5|nr:MULTISPECIES: cell division protein ZapC domain-containing protein [Aliagarivorans]